jgi:hypothetical protein
MEQKFFAKYCEAAVSVFNSQYEATRVIQHAVTAGQAREQIIRDFLQAHLPELVSVVSGEIVDAQNSYSKQQDVVLVLKSIPRLPFASGSDIIFQEGVVATIEIKTNLSSATLASIGDNISSVRGLTSSLGASAQLGITHSWPSHRILTGVLTYAGSSFESHVEALSKADENAKPDLLLDLQKGLMVRNHGLLLPTQTTADYLVVDGAALGFMFFMTFLTEITSTLTARGVTWRKYW